MAYQRAGARANSRRLPTECGTSLNCTAVQLAVERIVELHAIIATRAVFAQATKRNKAVSSFNGDKALAHLPSSQVRLVASRASRCVGRNHSRAITLHGGVRVCDAHTLSVLLRTEVVYCAAMIACNFIRDNIGRHLQRLVDYFVMVGTEVDQMVSSGVRALSLSLHLHRVRRANMLCPALT